MLGYGMQTIACCAVPGPTCFDLNYYTLNSSMKDFG